MEYNPVTLEKSSNVIFYPDSTNFLVGESALSSVPDKNSARLFIDTLTNPLASTSFEQISLNLGITVSNLKSVLIDVNNSDNIGTNWINYDFRSLEKDFGINDFSNTKIDLHFSSLPSTPHTIEKIGDLSTSQGFIQLDDNTVENIFKEKGSVFLVINFSPNVLTISNESNLQPIVFDLFSFGIDSSLDGINNSIYRFELEETSDNSSSFEGTFEYAFTNQLNLLDVNFIKKINTIDDDVKFLLTDRLVDEDGISISYSDLAQVGLSIPISTGSSSLTTHSGVVSAGSTSYRFGQPVVVILNEPDLNLKSDKIDTYHVIDDPSSPNVDTVGKNGVKMLEILLKDVRYKRCTINGVETGGLASTGFVLIETGDSTGIFEGVFRMPTQICNKSGTQLISPAGGSIEIKYYDSRDESGTSNIFSSLKNRQSITTLNSISDYPQLSTTKIQLPLSDSVKEVILSGSIDNQKRGTPLSITLIHPNGKIQEFGATVTNSGNYRAIFSIHSNSLPGNYEINLEYAEKQIGSVSFNVTSQSIPSWFKDNAKLWSSSVISDPEFIGEIEHLIEEKIIVIPLSDRISISDRAIPDWVKNNVKWWTDNLISDKDFVKLIQYLIKKGIIQV